MPPVVPITPLTTCDRGANRLDDRFVQLRIGFLYPELPELSTQLRVFSVQSRFKKTIALEIAGFQSRCAATFGFSGGGSYCIGLKTEAGDEAYLPAVDTNILTTAYVLNALETSDQNRLLKDI